MDELGQIRGGGGGGREDSEPEGWEEGVWNGRWLVGSEVAVTALPLL